MEASNLGQIVGRFLYGELPRAPRREADVAPARRSYAPRGLHREKVLELVAARGSVTCGEVAEVLGLTSNAASMRLTKMQREGDLARMGLPRAYVYHRPVAKPA